MGVEVSSTLLVIGLYQCIKSSPFLLKAHLQRISVWMTHIASCTHTVSLKDLLDQPYIHWPTRRSTSTQPAVKAYLREGFIIRALQNTVPKDTLCSRAPNVHLRKL